MALICRVLSAGSSSRGSVSRHLERLICRKVSPSHPPLSKSLQTPNLQINNPEDTFALNDVAFSWDALVRTLRSSSPEKAQAVLEWRLNKMLEKEKCPNQFSCFISLCGEIRNLSFAMHAFTLMEAQGIKPNTSVFNSLIYACLYSDNLVTALSLYEIMVSSEDYKPSPETYDTFISGFSSLGKVDAMHKCYLAKKAAGFSANVQTYESLISGCVKKQDFDGADSYLQEMVLSGVMPSIPIMENVLEGLCKRGSLGRVKEFLEYLTDGGWKITESMAEELVKFYYKHGKVDQMEELLGTLMKSNQFPEVLLQVHCGIIRLYALSDRLDDVEYSVGRMLKQGLSFKCADDVDKVLCLYFRCEEYDRLDLFLDHIKSSYKLTRSNYDFLIAGYRRAGLSEKLDSVMIDMKLAGLL